MANFHKEEQFWARLHAVALAGTKDTAGYNQFLDLLLEAYKIDMGILIPAMINPNNPSLSNQAFYPIDGKRYLLCYTNQAYFQKDIPYLPQGIYAEVRPFRDIMSTTQNRGGIIGGLTFNYLQQEARVVLKLRDLNKVIRGRKK